MNDQSELAGIYHFLGRLWLRELDEQTHLQWQSLLPSIPGFDESTAEADQDIETLQVEFCRLFIGPKDHLPPYQSVWQTGQLGGPASISMERFLETSGFQSNDNHHDTPPDHLGLQLQLFGWLLQHQATSDDVASGEVLAVFHQAHLTWPVEFLSRVAVAAETEFYRQLASTTLHLVSQTEN